MAPPGNSQPPSNAARYEDGPNNGMYLGAQTLGSTSSPATASRMSSSGTEGTYYAGPSGYALGGGGQTAPPNSSGLPRPSANSPPPSASANLHSQQRFSTSRQPPALGRQSEELHIPQNYAPMGQTSSKDPSGQNAYMSYNSSQESARGGQLQSVPGTLQPGNLGRPIPTSINTAPAAVPVLPPISTQTQSYSSPSRASTTSHSHSYSRSSPAAPFVNTPEDSKFANTPGHKYTSSQTPQSASYSPLGLADIRPRADSGLSDGLLSANPYSNEGYSSVATNCNYLAPWAVYAFDWCKWPVAQQGLGDSAGKMAIGSYLEDGHNFVSL